MNILVVVGVGSLILLLAYFTYGKFISKNKLNVHHWFFSSDLTHYKRGGRISATSAVVGNLLNI